MMSVAELSENLAQFHCTENYYKHMLGTVFTDGVKFLAENAECFWFVDLVASYQADTRIKKESFLVFNLKVNKDNSAEVIISDGNEKVLATQKIMFTDFPLPEFTLWCVDRVILLPGEY